MDSQIKEHLVRERLNTRIYRYKSQSTRRVFILVTVYCCVTGYYPISIHRQPVNIEIIYLLSYILRSAVHVLAMRFQSDVLCHGPRACGHWNATHGGAAAASGPRSAARRAKCGVSLKRGAAAGASFNTKGKGQGTVAGSEARSSKTC